LVGIVAAVARTLQSPALEERIARSKPDPRRFAMLVVALGSLLVVFKTYSLERPLFFALACLVFGGFAVSYWLPFRFKQTFFILLSLAGAFVLLNAVIASLLIAVGAMLFAIVRSGLAFRWKVLVFLAIVGSLAYARATAGFQIPRAFWPVFGALFMFRTIVYLYDLRHQPGPARLYDYLSYFFLLPNYCFLLFPVIDFETFRTSYFKRDIHDVAQQGVFWIFRGTTHLLLYRVIYQTLPQTVPPAVPVALAVVLKMIFTYLLYLRVSGQFHIIVGMLHLFGYDLPETNRRYLLAHSINDLWRRINVYWRDFMVKIVYFPAYFKLRRTGEVRAQLLATMLVFVATWFLHAYQFFWLQGRFRVTLNDILFWTVLGAFVTADIWRQNKRPKRLPETGWAPRIQKAIRIAATFALIAFLWSMWSADGMTEWFYFLRGRNI
jgi:alginate O-acetyltransferase complex protein AlgI